MGFEFGVDLAIASLAVVVAYMVFTLVGFGSALVASTPLAQVMPVAQVIPLLALLDFGGASLRAWRARQEVVLGALAHLVPGMLFGQLAGVYVLSRLPLAWMAVALAVFVLLLGLRGLRPRSTAARPALRGALAHGVFGGVLGGLFGSGGFIYATFLERHLESRAQFRATQGVVIALSTAWRIVLCIALGLLDWGVARMAMMLLPAMAIGVWAGHHVDMRLSREQWGRLLNVLLIVSGLALMGRYLWQL